LIHLSQSMFVKGCSIMITSALSRHQLGFYMPRRSHRHSRLILRKCLTQLLRHSYLTCLGTWASRNVGLIRLVLLSTTSTKVVVNDAPGQRICHGRGLRQGEPLSLMLFLKFMETLSAMFHLVDSWSLLQPLGGAEYPSPCL
jgi:hypothetical protein